MSYRRAYALDTFLAEVNKSAPKRNKVSDGWIGDAAHASRDSDHNPWVKKNGVGIVRAQDITHDPANGLDAGKIANHVASQLGKHPALGAGAYVIFNARIISTNRLKEGWRKYTGVNAHKTHVHVSVGTGNYDSTTKWGIASIGQKVTAAITKVTKLAINFNTVLAQAKAKKTKSMLSVVRLQKALNKARGAKLKEDGHFGSKTLAAYAAWQRSLGYKGKDADGVPGRASLSVLASRTGYRMS